MKDFVSLVVARLASRIERHAEIYLRRIVDIGVPEWRLLVYVYRFSCADPSEVARELNLPEPELQKLVDSLCAKHFCKIAPGNGPVRIEQTEVGRGIYETILPHMVERQDRMLSCLKAEESEVLTRMLEGLTANMDVLLQEQQKFDG
ncbi:MAG: MarR family winged helix-turn-helix transcriptional regulator [Beijerinckiaceae bacterium]